MSRAQIEAKADFLGVKICHHRESGRMKVAGLFHRLRRNPHFANTTYVTMHPWIFIPDPVADPFDDWKIIDHELVHWVRQRELGVYKWVWHYLTDMRFRAREEQHAFLRDIKNGRLSISQAVRRLQRPPYDCDINGEELEEWWRRRLSVRVPRRPSEE